MSTLTRTVAKKLLFSGAIIGGGTVALGLGTAAGLGLGYWAARRARRYDLAGRTVLITGGSRGLGLALARQFLKRGAKVAILGRDIETLERARQLLAGHGSIFVHPCDVRDPSQVAQAIRDVQETLGDIDVLVNNAGTLTVGPMDTMTQEDFEEALKIYFWAPFNVTNAVLPSMRKRKTGRIVNISSIGGRIAVPHLLAYSTGKFALAGWSEGLRHEIARDNVYVTTVFPGLMRTGSPRNAEFKGQHEAEYTWFVLSDAMPGLSVSADSAARQIVRACQYGKAELIVGLPAKFAIKAHALLPSVTSLALRSGNKLLPAVDGGDKSGKKGAQSQTAVTRSFLTTLDKVAAKRNNQISQSVPIVP